MVVYWALLRAPIIVLAIGGADLRRFGR